MKQEVRLKKKRERSGTINAMFINNQYKWQTFIFSTESKRMLNLNKFSLQKPTYVKR